MNLQSNDFELLGVPQQFDQQATVLEQHWKDLQRQVHPDKFAAQGAAAQRLSMQWSVRINEAYQRLKDPVRRASYLCELAGVAVDAHNNTAMPGEFLMQQMQWREAMEDAQDAGTLQALGEQVRSERQHLLQQCQCLLDADRDYIGAVAVVRCLMFIQKFASDLDEQMDLMEL
ncbi:MAG: Fe-S protein assembly co-chaperone HscB [Rhodoferax sp.]